MSELIKARHQIEIRLRGTALLIAAKFESALMNIIYFSNAMQYVNGKAFSMDLKSFMFHQKLQKAKSVLNKYHPDLAVSSEKLFEDLEQFKELRNHLAHCLISWPNNDLRYIDLWDGIEDEESDRYFVPVRYDVIELGEMLTQALTKISTPLSDLRSIIESRLQQSDPAAYARLTQATHNDGEAI